MKWINTQDRFIAFFDIMGFKDFIYRNDHEVVLHKMLDLKLILSPVKRDAERKLNEPKESEVKFYNAIIRPVVFSDSILLVSDKNTPEDLFTLLFSCTWIINKCIAVNIPIKGAISYGTLTADFDSSLYFGKPLIDAFQLQDSLTYYGCVIDNNVESYLKSGKDAGYSSKWLIKYKTPFKLGSVFHYNLNWLERDLNHNENDKLLVENKEKELNNYYNTVSGSTRLYVDHTIEFFEFCKKGIDL
jgi:hypothetical protein